MVHCNNTYFWYQIWVNHTKNISFSRNWNIMIIKNKKKKYLTHSIKQKRKKKLKWKIKRWFIGYIDSREKTIKKWKKNKINDLELQPINYKLMRNNMRKSWNINWWNIYHNKKNEWNCYNLQEKWDINENILKIS